MENLSYGLGTLYNRKNPNTERLATTAKIAENSGFAKPFLYYMMGKAQAEGEQWDTDNEAGIAKIYQENKAAAANQQTMTEVDKVLGRIVQAAKDNPQLATDLIDMAADQYPKQLGGMKGMKIIANSKDRFMYTETPDGSKAAIDTVKLAQIIDKTDISDEEKKTLAQQAVVPISGPKPPKVENIQKGTQNVPSTWNSETKQYDPIEGAGGPKWNPDKGKSGGGSGTKDTRTTTQRDYDRYASDERARGRIPVSFLDYLRVAKPSASYDELTAPQAPTPTPNRATRRPLSTFENAKGYAFRNGRLVPNEK